MGELVEDRHGPQDALVPPQGEADQRPGDVAEFLPFVLRGDVAHQQRRLPLEDPRDRLLVQEEEVLLLPFRLHPVGLPDPVLPRLGIEEADDARFRLHDQAGGRGHQLEKPREVERGDDVDPRLVDGGDLGHPQGGGFLPERRAHRVGQHLRDLGRIACRSSGIPASVTAWMTRTPCGSPEDTRGIIRTAPCLRLPRGEAAPRGRRGAFPRGRALRGCPRTRSGPRGRRGASCGWKSLRRNPRCPGRRAGRKRCPRRRTRTPLRTIP